MDINLPDNPEVQDADDDRPDESLDSQVGSSVFSEDVTSEELASEDIASDDLSDSAEDSADAASDEADRLIDDIQPAERLLSSLDVVGGFPIELRDELVNYLRKWRDQNQEKERELRARERELKPKEKELARERRDLDRRLASLEERERYIRERDKLMSQFPSLETDADIKRFLRGKRAENIATMAMLASTAKNEKLRFEAAQYLLQMDQGKPGTKPRDEGDEEMAVSIDKGTYGT